MKRKSVHTNIFSHGSGDEGRDGVSVGERARQRREGEGSQTRKRLKSKTVSLFSSQ